VVVQVVERLARDRQLVLDDRAREDETFARLLAEARADVAENLEPEGHLSARGRLFCS
jgi:hypothetical protein